MGLQTHSFIHLQVLYQPRATESILGLGVTWEFPFIFLNYILLCLSWERGPCKSIFHVARTILLNTF